MPIILVTWPTFFFPALPPRPDSASFGSSALPFLCPACTRTTTLFSTTLSFQTFHSFSFLGLPAYAGICSPIQSFFTRQASVALYLSTTHVHQLPVRHTNEHCTHRRRLHCSILSRDRPLYSTNLSRHSYTSSPSPTSPRQSHDLVRHRRTTATTTSNINHPPSGNPPN